MTKRQAVPAQTKTAWRRVAQTKIAMIPEPSIRRKAVYHQLMHRWGKATEIVTFDGSRTTRSGAFQSMDVAIWDVDDEADITSFNTLGMSEKYMPDSDYLVELHLGCRQQLSAREQQGLAALLANITEYPFADGLKLDWWECLANPGPIPVFAHATGILFGPAFGETALSWLEVPGGRVKLLYVIPITPREHHLLVDHGRDAFLAYIEQEDIDIFAIRKDR